MNIEPEVIAIRADYGDNIKIIEECHFGRYVFTEEEKRDIAESLAKDIREKKAAEEELQAMRSSMKAKIDKLNAKINEHSENYRNGYKYKNIDCNVVLDFKAKKRFYHRADTDELIYDEPLHDKDYQINAFEDEQPAGTVAETDVDSADESPAPEPESEPEQDETDNIPGVYPEPVDS